MSRNILLGTSSFLLTLSLGTAHAVTISTSPSNAALFESRVDIPAPLPVPVPTEDLSEDPSLAFASVDLVTFGAESKLGFGVPSSTGTSIIFSQDLGPVSGTGIIAESQTGLGDGFYDAGPSPYVFSLAADTEPAGSIFNVIIDFSLTGRLDIFDSRSSTNDQAGAIWSLSVNGSEVVNETEAITGPFPLAPGLPVDPSDVHLELSSSSSTTIQVADGDEFSVMFDLFSFALALGATSEVSLGGEITITAEPTNPLNPVPVPAAVWLFGSGLIALVGIARRKKHNCL